MIFSGGRARVAPVMPAAEWMSFALASMERTRRTKLALVPTLAAISTELRRHSPGLSIRASIWTAMEKRVARLISRTHSDPVYNPDTATLCQVALGERVEAVERIDRAAHLAKIETGIVRGGNPLAVAEDGGAGEGCEARAVMDAGFQEEIMLGRGIDSEAGEDALIPGFVMVRDDDDLDLPGIENGARTHLNLDPGIHGTAHDPFPVAQGADLARHPERLAFSPDRRHVGLAAQGQREGGAHPRLLHLPHGLRVAHRRDRDVVEPLADHFGQYRHHILGAAGADIIGVIKEQHRPFIDRLGAGHGVLERLVAIKEF